ncbi:aminoacyl-tRNA hydrolase [Polynucleobacter sp. AP-Nino-20-G2]|uniref:aminoacyl-tRNA hydrolase n=1 Tax=Polynucleobacter sp. AP-Nino-20-G2 TaxID=2576917 RepID=UPI001BFE135F|nr:aminoacyl-tRNA hydrolase [Polynucleobacter sp. AP-Nino-20-G2]QWE16519.1 aminoacyl-tRNA hydrolase [Polynucleobacter sp. AP-Nino-20-G2]
MTKLIVGLGNPGDEHEEDRHNAGFWLVDALAKQLSVRFETEKRFHGKVAKARWEGEDLYLLKPNTYMNLSGQAVGALCRFHKIIPKDVLVVQDELDLKPGTARIKLGGGTGGHNGLKDIQAHLSTPDYWRLRLGIGHPRDLAGEGARPMDVADYVLRRPLQVEQKKIDASIQDGLQILPLFLKGDTQTAMLELHSKTN